MLALSIRQPWAWLILHAGKDIENRSWSRRVRGRVLIHAAKGMSRGEYADAFAFAEVQCGFRGRRPEFDAIERGGIVGSVEIVDCVTASASPWFMGEHGFVLREPRVLPFVPWRGELGFFACDLALARRHAQAAADVAAARFAAGPAADAATAPAQPHLFDPAAKDPRP